MTQKAAGKDRVRMTQASSFTRRLLHTTRAFLLMHTTISICCASILLFMSDPAQASTTSEERIVPIEQLLAMNLEELMEVKITLATGTAKPLRLAPATASVITAKDIKRMGATTLDEVLDTVPGLHTAISGLNRFDPTYSIRGIHTKLNPQVLFLVNGLPFKDLFNAHRLPTARMSVAMISRVEIIRGPGSALHGADALSGVINVVTKNGMEIDGTEMGMRYGSFDTSDLWVLHGGEYSGWEVALGVERQKSAGDDSRIVARDALGNTPPSQAPGVMDTEYEQWDINLKLKKNNLALGLYGSLQVDNDMGPNAIFFTHGSDQDNESFLADITYHRENLLDNWDMSLRLSGLYSNNRSHFQLTPPGFLNLIGSPDVLGKYGAAEYTSVYSGFDNHVLRLGMGARFEDISTDEEKNFGHSGPPGAYINVQGTPYIFCTDHGRRILYGLIQDEWAFARNWELTAGVRFDDYSNWGNTVNPRAALVWEAHSKLTIKMLYGEAFRAPSISEQYLQNNPLAVGNPNIQPETIETYEMVFSFQPNERIQTTLNLYSYTLEDLIENTGSGNMAVNSRDQDGYGFELEGEVKLTDTLQLRANYSRQRSKDKNTKVLVADAPGVQFFASAHWEFLPKWSLNIQYDWVGDRKRGINDTRPEIDDYNLTKLTLRRQMANHWAVAFSIRNLFDQDVRIPSSYTFMAPGVGGVWMNDYPGEGRSIWAEVSSQF